MDAWIDTYHAVQRLTRQGTYVFLTDSAVGAEEEDNLRHLVTNLGRDVPRDRIVPFLTSKHTLDYCYSYADRAHQHGFPRARGAWRRQERRNRRVSSNTPGNCGSCCASAIERWSSAAGRIRTPIPTRRSITSPTPTSTRSST